MNEPVAFDKSGAHWALTNSQDVGPLASHIRSVSTLAMRLPGSARVRMQTGAGIEIDELWERKSPAH